MEFLKNEVKRQKTISATSFSVTLLKILLRDDAGGSRLPVLQRHYLLIYKFNTMKNLKFLLPMLAMIFAIGLMFATPTEDNDPDNDYVILNGSWEAIPEQNCEAGEFDCQVRYGQNGPVLEVYDAMGDEEPKPSGTETPTVINP
ncbi:DUF6520 family protein [Autumnicola edwardsiae]|uniref:DUF6520 family protein n=1 Tax=Autumnicola edwardsiae TaxID=3075594 RepID=A0ABU3CWR8_9FLAO|nr:DUF6520 family protein [Zunongwangia sp. F297]MDT0650805.1 DUF6520 family protein [Zunongwangia sp. F297]|tara:strand:+ start:11560 stop:11991 length:432 start_codon:yes stop_codon:yes gene_type:complete